MWIYSQVKVCKDSKAPWHASQGPSQQVKVCVHRWLWGESRTTLLSQEYFSGICCQGSTSSNYICPQRDTQSVTCTPSPYRHGVSFTVVSRICVSYPCKYPWYLSVLPLVSSEIISWLSWWWSYLCLKVLVHSDAFVPPSIRLPEPAISGWLMVIALTSCLLWPVSN